MVRVQFFTKPYFQYRSGMINIFLNLWKECTHHRSLVIELIINKKEKSKHMDRIKQENIKHDQEYLYERYNVLLPRFQ